MSPLPITMCVTSNMFIMGKLNGSRLVDPRVFTIFDNGKQMQLSPLPANPTSIILRQDGFTYEIPGTEKNLLDLYHKVTHPQPQIVMPEPTLMAERPKLAS